ncbi:chromobox protein homolog 2-like [Drosophila subpulchrella]|uniref:chromobox protein homolog 2-like n=1 Tax=Drosophila subpulchrella TaxID=1486046 RepID=UPI0018A1AC51|nr:chromobox protein homolog 2-like [Drosophila subpulchrella]
MSGEQPDKSSGSSDESVPFFTVEKIIGKRLVKSRLEYLVKWEGFSKNENSWEPIEHVWHCSDLICNFEAELMRQGKAQEAATHNEPVEKILDKRLAGGCVQYLVKWLGYPKEDNSWETMQALNHCLDLLGDFEAQLMARSQGQEAQLMAPSQDQEATTSAGSSQWPSGRPKRMRALSQEQLVDQKAVINSPAVPKRRRRGPCPRQDSCIVFLDESSDLGTPEAAVASQSAAAPAPQETNEPISSEEPPSDVLVMEPSHSTPPDLEPIHSAPPALEQPQVGAGAHCALDMPGLDTEQEELPGCSSASNLAPNSWKMPQSKETFGLKRGLELDKVYHSFAVREHLFLFVTWKGCPTVDAVPLEDLAKKYPIKVLEYFDSLEKIP